MIVLNLKLKNVENAKIYYLKLKNENEKLANKYTNYFEGGSNIWKINYNWDDSCIFRGFASENVIIDKEVTGVNKEQLENYKGDNNILINKNVESVNDDNIKSNNYQRQKQIIRLENVDDSVNESLMNKKTIVLSGNI